MRAKQKSRLGKGNERMVRSLGEFKAKYFPHMMQNDLETNAAHDILLEKCLSQAAQKLKKTVACG